MRSELMLPFIIVCKFVLMTVNVYPSFVLVINQRLFRDDVLEDGFVTCMSYTSNLMLVPITKLITSMGAT